MGTLLPVRIGVGLPNTVLGARGGTLLAWARRAEDRGFATLATIDRINYPTFDSLTALSAAAGATERIGLMTNVLLAPTYDPVHLAKQTGSLALLSGGRLRLGLGIGTRADDYEMTGTDFSDRGRRFDAMLETLHEAWGDAKVVPAPVEIPLLIGGQPRFAAPRALRWGAGWTIGGGGPDLARQGVEAFGASYRAAGGTELPPVTALEYFSLGNNQDESRETLLTYYGHIPELAERISQGAPRTAESVRSTIAAYEALGIDELILVGTAADPEQVDLLAEIARPVP